MEMEKRRWPLVYLLSIGAVSLATGFYHAVTRSPWTVGDFLINYKAGFVRRGLMGAIGLFLARGDVRADVWIVFLVQAASYVVFLFCVYRLSLHLRRDYALSAIFLSPATLSFMVFEPSTAFRKEVLLFAVLGLLTVPGGSRLRDWQLSAALSASASALVLSHEALFVYLPYLFGAVVLSRTFREAVRICLAPALCATAAVAAAMLHPGSHIQAEEICRSLGGRLSATGSLSGSGLCDGAIAWLEVTPAQSHRAITDVEAVQHYSLIYGAVVLLAFLPIAIQLWRMFRIPQLEQRAKKIVATACLALAGSLPLFYVGSDWGRWVSLHCVCLMLLIFKACQHVPAEAGEMHFVRRSRSLALCVLVLYATTWNLPLFAGSSYLGYFALARRAYGVARR